jgi:hypothetical protein
MMPRQCQYCTLSFKSYWKFYEHSRQEHNNGPCHVSGIFLPLRVNSLPLATIYEVKIPLRKWKISLLQRNPAHMTWAIDIQKNGFHVQIAKSTFLPRNLY